ncbi:MAG: phage tail protein [bacterium]
MEPFIGEIKMVGFNFAPRGWAFCDGQLLAISSNSALFSLLGTMYGGDGRTSFGLPDLRGRVSIHQGTGPGLSNRRMGEKGGAETTTQTTATMANHSHPVTVHVVDDDATTNEANGASLANAVGNTYSTAAVDGTLSASSATSANVGGGQAMNNMEPFLVVNYVIALTGIYPSRN